MSDLSHSEVTDLALIEMSKWGIIDKGWKFVINKSLRRLGQCSYKHKIISVSAYHIEHNPDDNIINTILHEIAHALHYHHYADNGRLNEFSACVRRGKRFVRKVKPHGKEWKRFAAMVGCVPKATAKSNIQQNIGYKWNLVTVQNGIVTDQNFGYYRFPKRLSCKYMLKDKTGTKGKLYLVPGDDWVAYLKGKLNLSDLTFYQDCNYSPALRIRD